MNSFFKIECTKCNQSAEVLQEQKQEEIAKLSKASSRLQHFIEPEHFSNYQLTLNAKVSNKIQACGRKLSLKNTKKDNIKCTELSKSSSKQNLHQSSAQQKLKSPKTNITISYRPSSFFSQFKHNQLSKQDFFKQFKQQNEANFYNLSISKQKLEYSNYQQEKSQSQQQTQQYIQRSMFINKQPNAQTLTKREHSNHQNSSKEELSDRETKVVRRKKVHFTQFKQNQDQKERQEKYRDKFSAFGSIVNLNQRISNDDLGEYNSSVNTFVETKQNIVLIEEQSKHEIRRIAKKNMTFFKQEQKRFVGLRTVYTLKSMDNPSERSFLDLNYMQTLNSGLRNKLLM